jgi:hypothetical protein
MVQDMVAMPRWRKGKSSFRAIYLPGRSSVRPFTMS